MLLGVDRRDAMFAEPMRGQRAASFLLGAAVLAEVIVLGTGHWTTGASAVSGKLEGQGANVNVLGKSLFTTYLLAFEVTSALLIVAAIAAVVLTRRDSQASPEPELGEREAIELAATRRAETAEVEADDEVVGRR